MKPPSPRGILQVLRSIFVQDIGLKVSSLFAAILFFSAVHGADDAQKAVFVDLITLLPSEDSGRMLVSEVPVHVRATLSGSRSQLNAIQQNQLAPVQIDLRGHQGAEYVFDEDDLDLPVGVSIAEWVPPSIPLEYAVRAERAFAVRPRFDEEALPEGFAFGQVIAVVPSTVGVTGPEDDVDTIQEVSTEPISLAGFGRGEHQLQARLMRLPGRASYTESSSVLVRFTIEAEQRERRLRNVVVSAIGRPVRGLRPSKVDLVLRGAPTVVNGLEPEHVIPFVDASGLDPDAGATPLLVQVRGLPGGVEVLSISPNEVIVTPER